MAHFVASDQVLHWLSRFNFGTLSLSLINHLYGLKLQKANRPKFGECFTFNPPFICFEETSSYWSVQVQISCTDLLSISRDISIF